MEMINFFSSVSWIVASVLFVGIVSLIACFFTYTSRKLRSDSAINRWIKVWGGISLASVSAGIIVYKLAMISIIGEIDKAITSPEVVVFVNGSKIEDNEAMVAGFQTRSGIKKSGSHPTEVWELRIQSGDLLLDLELKRDSRDRDLYWVYYPSYRAFSNLYYVRVANLK